METTMNDITNFISAAVEDKPLEAIKAFSSAMEPKIDAALEKKVEEISSQLFNKDEQETEE
jgi:hypothetical protein